MSPDKSVRFGKYLLLDRIGIGGMAEVFKAKLFGAEGFERLIAIKRILPHLVEDDDFVKMFVDEAKIAVRLNHPNIVGIQDLGKAEGTLYIAMEYVLGKDLRAIYDVENERGGRLPVGLACHVVMKMCEALHHAHFAHGPQGEPLQVIHRDVSPQNVLVSFDGEVKVADFGLAKARGRMVQTQAGVVKGKLAYMSPEQLRGDEIDHRVDVFGLGIVLFELLSGQRLFLGASDMETLRRVYDAKVPSMQSLNPEVQPELERIVRRALTKDRDARYGTALELHDDLQAYVYGHGVYAGASRLRKYMRDAFPGAAPSDALAPPPVASPERVTARPRRSDSAERRSREPREVVPPPPPVPPESGVLAASAPPPPQPPGGAAAEEDLEAAIDSVISVDLDLDPIEELTPQEADAVVTDERPTDRPPAAGSTDQAPGSTPPTTPQGPAYRPAAVFRRPRPGPGEEGLDVHRAETRQVVAPSTQLPASGKIPAAPALPDLPEGVYVDELSTDQLAHGPYDEHPPYDPGPDTNPAPAPLAELEALAAAAEQPDEDVDPWDEPTVFTKRAGFTQPEGFGDARGQGERSEPTGEAGPDEEWAGERTKVVDPASVDPASGAGS